jgi:hypothetical protein
MITPSKRQYDPGPYSTLFDYEKEFEWEKERAKQKQASQQKILRTNAIGDALNLLMESVGGSQGATINKRPPNPFLLKASGRYNEIGDRLDAREGQLRMMDLVQKEKDLGYRLGEKRRDEDIAREDRKAAEQRTWQEGRDKTQDEWADTNREDTQVFQTGKDLKDFEQQKEIAKINAGSQRNLAKFNTDENIRQSKAIQDYKMKPVDRKDRSKKVLEWLSPPALSK